MHKFLIFGCRQMREGILFAFSFLTAGIIMMLVGLKLMPPLVYLNHIVTVIGMLLFFFSPVILVSTFLLTVMPGLRKYTDDCD